MLVEKPLDVALDRIDRLIEIADANDATVAGVFQRPFSPERITSRQWIEGVRFGDVVLAAYASASLDREVRVDAVRDLTENT